MSKRLSRAVAHFWKTRTRQDKNQGKITGQRDQGNRAAVTGGKHLEGIGLLIAELIAESGVPRECIHLIGRDNLTLPGYFRPTKLWDMVVMHDHNLLGALESKALCGPSFGNNYNNRVEESLGSSTDVWTAYREGVFQSSPQPCIGYFLLLEESEGSTRPVGVVDTHFPVVAEFRGASYEQRCEQTLRRMVRERCYSTAAFVVSRKSSGIAGKYREPADDLSFTRFGKYFAAQILANYQAVKKS